MGWANGISIPSKTGKFWVTSLIDNDFIVANLKENITYVLKYKVMQNEEIPEGYTTKWETNAWGTMRFCIGTNQYLKLAGESQLDKALDSIKKNYFIETTIETPSDLSSAVVILYGIRYVNESDRNSAFIASTSFSDIVLYEYQSEYDYMDVNNNTMISIPNNHTLTAKWIKE